MRRGLGIGGLACVAGPVGPTTGTAASFGCAARMILRTAVLGRAVLTARFDFAATVRSLSGAVPDLFLVAAFFTAGCFTTVFFAAVLGRTGFDAPFGLAAAGRGRTRAVPSVFSAGAVGRAALAGRFGFAATVRGWSGGASAVFFAAAVGRTASTGPFGFVNTARGRARRAGRLAVAGRFLPALEACSASAIRVEAVFLRGFIASHRS